MYGETPYYRKLPILVPKVAYGAMFELESIEDFESSSQKGRHAAPC